MPTLILLDVSLSMSRPAGVTDGPEDTQYRNLAIHGIDTFLDYLATHSKLEFVSLVIFSSSWECVVPWTRDYGAIKTALASVEEYNKSCFDTAFSGVASLCMEEWGCNNPCQIILVTDGNIGLGDTSLKSVLDLYSQPQPTIGTSSKPTIPFPFPSKIHVMCVNNKKDKQTEVALTEYTRLVDMNKGGGEVETAEAPLSLKTTAAMFSRLADKHFKPYAGELRCGNLRCAITMYPPPTKYHKADDFEMLEKSVSKTLQVCGFLNIADIGSPPYIARHIILPTAANSADGAATTTKDEEAEDDATTEADKPALTVLLHGSLKVGSMVALTQLAENWYGIMYSWADKKKSNLMLAVFKPGTDVLPWLGKLSQLGPLSDFKELPPPYGDHDEKSPFPVRPAERRSYTQNCVVWIKNTGLQADIQKILRNARKIPEKQIQFYKELNRLRKAALSLGFYELLDAMAQLLDRECQLLPGNSHPDAALQLTHAANILRSELALDVNNAIMPLVTNFTTTIVD